MHTIQFLSKHKTVFAAGTWLAFVSLIGCGSGGNISTRLPTGAEPTGGRWATVLLTPSDTPHLEDPPDSGSTIEQQEIARLHALEGQRTAEGQASITYWNAGACLRWNETARDLVAKYKTPPPMAARAYALLSVAQYDALIAAYDSKYTYHRVAPSQRDTTLKPLSPVPLDPVYPSTHAVVASASCAVLASLYPQETQALVAKASEAEQSRLLAGVNYPSDITAGDSLGAQVAGKVIAYAQADNSNMPFTGTIPTGPGYWTGTNPVLPMWGSTHPWLMSRGDQFRPTAPPAVNSSAFMTALEEVRHIAQTRTPEQTRIAQFWADGGGTATPPGHWNQIASDLLTKYHWNELRSARAYALLNRGQMDAGICCWDCKYVYWLLRPSQADPTISLAVPLPNFPSYASGHAAFSGASATVLSYLFPQEASAVQAMAQEAAISRVYGGIHYRFDSEAGLKGGQQIGQLAVESARNDGAP